MAGIHAEIRTMFAQSAQNYIVASRISQGNEDLKNATAAEREDIERRWLGKRDEMSGFYTWRQKDKGKSRDTSPARGSSVTTPPGASTESLAPEGPPRTGWRHTRHLSWDERKRLQEQKQAWKKRQAAGPHVTEHINHSDPDFEQAIQAAVQETSSGDSLEDARIEQAIRSSIRELRRRSTISSNSSASNLSRATDPPFASTAATSAGPRYGFPSDTKHQMPFSPDDFDSVTDEEYQSLIEQAVQLSIAEDRRLLEDQRGDEEELQRALTRSQTDHTPHTRDNDLKMALKASEAEHTARVQHGHDGQDDEEQLKEAIEASQADERQRGSTDLDNEEELRRAIEESEKAHQEEVARVNAQKTEEEIVMEFVKQQSLAEEQFRSKGKGKEAVHNDDDDEDEDLRRAIEESMKATGKVGEGCGQAPGSGSERPVGPKSPKGSGPTELP
jgi:hypothetical protein